MKRFVLISAFVLMTIPANAQNVIHGVTRGITLDISGGYAYTALYPGTGWPNVNGFYGSLGVNLTPWLQLSADASEQYGSLTGASTKLYGNHFGPRFFYRPRGSMTSVFAEFLVGGSRLDVNVSGPGGARYSTNGFSLKTGGGVDFRITQHWSVRAFHADYYRMSFLQGQQNNLWLSAGIVYNIGRRRFPR